MSNSPNFFVQGRIEKDTDVFIVAKTVITGTTTNLSPNIFSSSTGITSGNTMWSVLGAQETYTPYEDLKKNKYYHYDGTNYYYPLYIDSTGVHNVQYNVDPDPLGLNFPMFYNGTLQDITHDSLNANFNYINIESLVNLQMVVKNSTGNYYPVFINSGTGHTSRISVQELNDRFLYSPGTEEQTPKPVEPENSAKLILSNPFQSNMYNNFTVQQSSIANQGLKFSLNTSKDFKNISLDDNDVLICSSTESSKFFNLQPKDSNVDNTHLYAGVEYTMNPSDNINSKPKLNIFNSLKRDNSIIEKAGIQYLSSSTPNANSFLAATDVSNLDRQSTTTITITNTTTTLYFIPGIMYHISTNNRLENLAYHSLRMFVTSPQVFNIRPKILTGSRASGNTNYYKWVNEVKISTDPSELAFATKTGDAHTGIVTRYCNTNEFCGKCFGVCNPRNTINPSNLCILDTESVSEFNKGEDYFTCDHDRYVNSSDYVKNGTISHHSNSFILILIILAIVIGAGIILFEERKMILKRVLSTKNGH